MSSDEEGALNIDILSVSGQKGCAACTRTGATANENMLGTGCLWLPEMRSGASGYADMNFAVELATCIKFETAPSGAMRSIPSNTKFMAASVEVDSSRWFSSITREELLSKRAPNRGAVRVDMTPANGR